MKIAVASDHAGYHYKEKVKAHLAESGYAVRDFYLNRGSQAIIVRLFKPMFADDAERRSANTQ